jgi:hypothetical protein
MAHWPNVDKSHFNFAPGGLKPGRGPNLNAPQVFSGSDVAVVFSIPGINPAKLAGGSVLESVQLQTITISSATSVNPVRRLGEAKVAQFVRGGRTFAGSMVFTVIGQDPFQQIFAVDTIRNSVRTDGAWHIDQMPAFDAILLCQNETGGVGIQMISNISLVNWGTTYSVDDLYIESTYSYVAEHVSPFVNNKFDSFKGIQGEDIFESIKGFEDALVQTEKDPDNAATPDPQNGFGRAGQLATFPTFSTTNPEGFQGGQAGIYTSILGDYGDPGIPPSIWIDDSQHNSLFY